ncbi:hypothetical protein CDD80_7526 [Ophiocordyceps camponoti-rufipedis]|uniref:F-box domain-containing protein n=1 Tax=Ophiocordyceps camponoti-rufipedis TaxID=2004952 RepID=A0A2C5YNB9_9HYPO|nr:hypothetical protein CDD80_7526 [Ophiocordyceps camponoti-rufipedis]
MDRVFVLVSAPSPALSAAPTRRVSFMAALSMDRSAVMVGMSRLILTHILSHLHPDSHPAVALVSKRFYALVTSPHAWRMAFLRYFAGHTVVEPVDHDADKRISPASGVVRLDTRYFSRLTALAGWRSEYLLRTRLLRGLTRGKPGSRPGAVGSSGRAANRTSAVLTYNSKLLCPITNVHAILSNGGKPPRVIHGAAHLGVATISDPTTGKVEKWGLEDPFFVAQMQVAALPYGEGGGPASVPSVMDRDVRSVSGRRGR